MNTFINHSTQPLTVHTPEGVRRSCGQCDYIGLTPDIKCPKCGKIPLVAVSQLKNKGILKIAQGVLPAAIIGAALFAVGNYSPLNEISFVRTLFRGDPLSLALIGWGIFIAAIGGGCEIIDGIWLIFYAKPNQTIKALKPVLRVLYVVTGLVFVIVNKINGYD